MCTTREVGACWGQSAQDVFIQHHPEEQFGKKDGGTQGKAGLDNSKQISLMQGFLVNMFNVNL